MVKIDKDYISSAEGYQFHGDCVLENIIHKDGNYTLIDWRQDFGGITQYGDIYYDLAKMYGGMILSYQLIKEGMFSFDMSGSSVYYNFYIINT